MDNHMRKRKARATPVNSFRTAERALKAGISLSANQVAKLIENSPDQALPPALRDHVVGLLVDKSRMPRGAGRRNDGFIWDFIVADARELYSKTLARFRAQDKQKRAAARAAGYVRPRAEDSACERAAKYVFEAMKSDLPGVNCPKTLQNILSAPMRCYFSDADKTPPDDYDPPDHIVPEKPYRVIPLSEQRTPKN